VYKWILPSLSEVLTYHQSTAAVCSPAKAQQQWRISLAAAEKLLLKTLASISPDGRQKGLVLAAPAPVFSHPELTQSLQSITFTAQPFNPLALMPFEMSQKEQVAIASETSAEELILPLLKTDPLAKEQFCLIFTEQFRLVLVLADQENGKKVFLFSFEPEVTQLAWRALGARVMLNNPDLFTKLEDFVQKYSYATPDYRIVMQFSQLLLAELPEEQQAQTPAGGYSSQRVAEISCPVLLAKESVGGSTDAAATDTETDTEISSSRAVSCAAASSPRSEVELLQAFAHEVRTPLTTIRTLVKLLLKQRGLPANVIQRLQIIERECTEQIDRMELLFRAAELEICAADKPTTTQLTAMCLEQVLQASIPRWQEAANRRNLTLDVILPQNLPTVISNPTMLDRVLTGLMENFTRSLPAGSHIQVQVVPAGNQLKLQLVPQPQVLNTGTVTGSTCSPPVRKAVGQLLTFQPETGTISLNLAATKHLFQAIGGKLIVRERPQYGEVLTIFLPLEGAENKGNAKSKTGNF
jgi:hypothetical protein